MIISPLSCCYLSYNLTERAPARPFHVVSPSFCSVLFFSSQSYFSFFPFSKPATAAVEDSSPDDDEDVAMEGGEQDEGDNLPPPASRAACPDADLTRSTEAEDETAPVNRAPFRPMAVFTGPEAPRPRGLAPHTADPTATLSTEHTVTKQLDFNTSDMTASALSHARDRSVIHSPPSVQRDARENTLEEEQPPHTAAEEVRGIEWGLAAGLQAETH